MTDYNKMERNEAKRDNVKLVKNSGRGYMKGDARTERFLIDYKFNATSFALSLKNWTKLQKDAWKEGQRFPMICVKFANDQKVGIVPWEILKEAGLLDDNE
jgi:hypothetical protein